MKKRRLLSIVLSLCMVLALMPASAYAETIGGLTLKPAVPGTCYLADFTDSGQEVPSDYNINNRVEYLSIANGTMIIEGNKTLYYHDVAHGLAVFNDNCFYISVAGNAEISFVLCAYSKEGKLNASVDTDKGELNTESIALKGSEDGEVNTFYYRGEAATIRVTISGCTGESYLHGIRVNNIDKTVTFDSNGGSSVPEQKVVDGDKVTEPTVPTREGYEFAGWYNGDTKYDFTQNVTENITLTAHWESVEVPVITVLENGKTYCDAVEFEVTDNVGVASVKAGDEELTPTNGKYTLKKGICNVTVVAKDNASYETSVTVTVNNGHTAGADDGDCTTPVYCIYHSDTIVIVAKSHNFSGDWNKSSTNHWHICQNEGCTVTDTQTSHSGGSATCTAKAECEYCGEKYGELNGSNHYLANTPAKDATYSEAGYKEHWQCKDCKKYFSDAAGTTEIADIAAWKAGDGKINKLTLPSKTDSVTLGKDGSVTVTLDKSISSSGGKTTATVTDSVTNTVLAKLAFSESKSVVIDATADSGTSTQVVISESAVKKLAEIEGIEITLVTDNGKVVLDKDTLTAVASKAGNDGQVAFIIETVEQSGNILKVELKIQTSGGDVTGFDGGKVTVTVVIDDELKGRNPVCVYIDEQNLYSKIGGMLNDDGTFTFVTGHFSTYAIMPEADADAVIKEQTAVAQKAAIKNVKTTVTLSTKEVKKGIRVTVKVPENQKADKTGIIIYRSTKKDAKPYAVYKKVETKGSTYIIRNYYNVKGNRLVKGKTYYYKARAYKVIDGKTYYGPMSTIKAIKAK